MVSTPDGNLARDARYAACAALLGVALGVGANTAVFSVVNGMRLRPLPYADHDRLVMIFASPIKSGKKACR